jgi:curli biogenesis system outer membrane secretion channel CsgG
MLLSRANYPALLAGFLIAAACMSGCSSYSSARGGGSSSYGRKGEMMPVVAVMDFENKASFSGQWNLGQGMADVMVTKLIDSKRVEVLERQHLNDVVGEIVRQGQDLFRKEGRVERGRLKNAQYVIRGAVTDFTVTGDSSGWFGLSNIKGFGRGSKARVAIHVRLSDVESGQVLTSVKTEGEATAGGFGGAINYKEVSFGGDAYFRTPLGKATESAMGKAVRKLVRAIPAEFWQARVAEVNGSDVIINGGRNAGVREGDVYYVREPARDVTDPVTGNVIERATGKVTGKVVVKEVLDASAHAAIDSGSARRGDSLEALKK